MKKLMIAAGIVSTLIFALLCGLAAVAQRFAPVSRIEWEREQLAIERAQALAPLQTFAAAMWTVIPIVAIVGGLVYLASLGVAHIVRFRGERQPDAAGLLPVPREELGDFARLALTGYHQARIEDARRALPSQTLTYSPHYAPQHRLDYRADGSGVPLLPAAELDPVGELQSFGELLSAGRIGRGQPLLLGYDVAEGAPIWGSWRDLYSAGVGGAQGGGKSWTAASLIAQSMLNGARVILCDPHAGDEESLTTRLSALLPHIEVHADDPKQIAAAARFAADELGRRREKKSSDRTPILLVIDEWTSLLRRGLGDTLPPILADLTQEGRKYGVNALLLAQRWSVDAAGGGDVRNTLTAHYIHRTRADEARMQTGLRGNALPDDTMQLQPGQSYLVDTRGGVRKVATPQMSAADLGRVAGLLGPAAGYPQATTTRLISPPPEAWGKPTGSLREASAEQATTAPGSAEAARALALFREGRDIAQIVAELRGVKSSQGRRYQEAAAEVQALLRAAMGGAA